MKKLSVVIVAMFFCLTVSIAYAIDAKRMEKIEIAGQDNNKDFFDGTVKVADLGKEHITEVVPPRISKAPKTVPIPSKAVLSSGQVVIAMPMEGEWFRLGSRYCGTKTIYDFVLQICKRDFTKSVLADNHLTFEKAKRLGVGHKVFVRHIYLKDEYKFGLEKDRKSQGELDSLRRQLSTQQLELKKALQLLAEKIELNSLQKKRIKELREINSELTDGAAKTLSDKPDVTQIEDLKKQLAEKTDELEGAGHRIDTLVNEAAHLDRDLKTEQNTHTELKGSFDIIESKHEVLSAEHADLKEMFKQQMATFNTLGQKIEAGFDRLEKEKVELKGQIEKLKAELETAQKQLKECQKKTFISG